MPHDSRMPRLEIYVVPGCASCIEARRIGQRVKQLPNMDVRVVEIGAGETPPDAVVAVPTYLLDGQVISLGNPDPRALIARLAGVVFSTRGPLVLASGTALGSILLCLVLLLFGGACLAAGPFQVNLALADGALEVAGVVALVASVLLGRVAAQSWRRRPTLGADGLMVDGRAIEWADVVTIHERDGHGGALDVLARNGRRLRISTRSMDAQTVLTLRAWLLPLARDADDTDTGESAPGQCPRGAT